MPAGSDVVVMLSGGLIVMLSAWVLVCGGVLESLAETVKLDVPAAVGVPEIAPEALRFRPVGKLPWLMLQVIVPVPPTLLSVAL